MRPQEMSRTLLIRTIVSTLAREYQKAEDPEYISISWPNQEKAATYFNEHGLVETLDEILRIGGVEALS